MPPSHADNYPFCLNYFQPGSCCGGCMPCAYSYGTLSRTCMVPLLLALSCYPILLCCPNIVPWGGPADPYRQFQIIHTKPEELLAYLRRKVRRRNSSKSLP